ncbi:MAG: zinc-binding dehydrogenase [Pseudomonadota bacterium]
MRACVATGEKGKIEYREVPEPELEPGTLLLKTRCSLICGSDIEYLQGLHGDIVTDEIRGHEFVAEVAAVGDGVRDWQVGDRAVPLSYTSNYGCWADYFVTRPVGVQKVPDNVADEDAVFVEPLHTGFGSAEACNLKPGEAVCVIGTGKIGLLTIMSAKIMGAAPIIAVDIEPKRLEKALEVGADYALNANDDDFIDKVKALTPSAIGHPAGYGPEAIVIGVRQGQVLNQAMEMAMQGGRIIVAGFIPKTEIDPELLVKKQLVISGVLAGRFGENRNNGVRSLRLLANEQMEPRKLISGTMRHPDIQEAVDATIRGEHLAVLLRP